MTKQWHPTFARLLRPLVESHFDVQTNVPVGDVPRAADLVLLRRITAGPLPFSGLWRQLTTWNVLEFKGPTVSPRAGDLDLLIELGLGIHRRLNEERSRQREPIVAPADVSFWYLANRLGRRFLGEARRHLGILEALGPGMWRCGLLERVVFLVSGTQLPVEQDSLPLHLVGKEPRETEREVAQFVVQRPALLEVYGGYLATLHPEAWKEVEAMAKTKREKFGFQIEPLIELVGLKRVIDAVGVDRVIDAVGVDRVIDAVGADRVIDAVGLDRLIKEKGAEWFLARISPEEQRKLKKLLK